MAYRNNYDDLLKDIQASGQSWSEYDLALAKDNPDAGRSIYTQKLAYANAQTDAERQAANDAAEMIRRQYGGYSAGGDGSGFTLYGNNTAAQKAPSYTQYASKYQSQIDDLMAQLSGRGPFSYTPTDDPSYAAYSEHYRNAGEQAREDTLAQAAAMVGGQPSSYAVAAAQQAQNAYNAQMSDIIPQLREAAYGMYVDEGNAMRDDLSLLMALDDAAYNRHQNEYANQMAEWEANYGVSRDAIEDARYDQEWALALQEAAKSPYRGGGGGDGDDPVSDGQDEGGLFMRASVSGNPQNYIAENYKDFGFEKSTGLWSKYKEWAGVNESTNDAIGRLEQAASLGGKTEAARATEFARKMIRSGQGAEVIYKNLKANGYSDEAIDAALAAVGL